MDHRRRHGFVVTALLHHEFPRDQLLDRDACRGKGTSTLKVCVSFLRGLLLLQVVVVAAPLELGCRDSIRLAALLRLALHVLRAGQFKMTVFHRYSFDRSIKERV